MCCSSHYLPRLIVKINISLIWNCYGGGNNFIPRTSATSYYAAKKRKLHIPIRSSLYSYPVRINFERLSSISTYR